MQSGIPPLEARKTKTKRYKSTLVIVTTVKTVNPLLQVRTLKPVQGWCCMECWRGYLFNDAVGVLPTQPEDILLILIGMRGVRIGALSRIKLPSSCQWPSRSTNMADSPDKGIAGTSQRLGLPCLAGELFAAVATIPKNTVCEVPTLTCS